MIKKTLILILVLLLIGSCNFRTEVREKAPAVYVSDLDQLRARGKIIAVTDFNSTNYFIYRGTPMGFHYELLKSFSDYTGINIEVITSGDINKSVELLNSGDADIIAIDLSINSERKEQISLTLPLNRSGQVLVQRKPNRWTSMSGEEIDKSLIRDLTSLTGKMVYVQAGSNSALLINRLNHSLGNKFTVIEVPFEAEKIITLVATRKIDYAVCEGNLAQVNARYYPVLDISTVVGEPEELAWGVRKEGSEKLVAALNEWIGTIKSNDLLSILKAKYYSNDNLTRIFKSDYYTLNTGKISPWDLQIKRYSETINWDWRLLASLIYQESRFKSNAVSYAGAHGLMQVMPETGERFGVDVTSSPENNLRGGVLYLQHIQKYFEDKIPDEGERIKFVLAAYNAGIGNVLDAMRLAEKYGRNPLLWDDNVAYFLLKKSDPEYYNDPVVKHGYCRGSEPVNFVAEILARYSEYRNFIP
ncbi:MAG: transporter substrate-binding domain-containing protein [Bacteroidales bacterium]